MNTRHVFLTAWESMMMMCVISISIYYFAFRTLCDQSSPAGGAHPHSSASALHARLVSLLHSFRPDHAEVNEPQQPSVLSGFHPHVLFVRLSSLIHRSTAENDAPNELQQSFTPSRLRLHALLARLPSLSPRSRLNTGEDTDSHPTMPSGSRSDTLMDLLSSLISSPPHTIEEIEPPQHATRLHVVDVAPMRDREVCNSPVCQSLASDGLHAGTVRCRASASRSSALSVC
jgi:hypothetical protein